MTDMPATVLVVEDEALIRLALVELFEERGYRVLDAGSADEAIVLLIADMSIAAVFTDVHMPGEFNGLDLADWIKRNRPSVPVVVTSGAATIEEAGARSVTGAMFVEKPYDFEHVVELVSSLL